MQVRRVDNLSVCWVYNPACAFLYKFAWCYVWIHIKLITWTLFLSLPFVFHLSCFRLFSFFSQHVSGTRHFCWLERVPPSVPRTVTNHTSWFTVVSIWSCYVTAVYLYHIIVGGHMFVFLSKSSIESPYRHWIYLLDDDEGKRLVYRSHSSDKTHTQNNPRQRTGYGKHNVQKAASKILSSWLVGSRDLDF